MKAKLALCLGFALALPAVAQDAEPIVIEREADTMLASELGSILVVGRSGETVGDVEEIVLSRDGRIVALVVGVGGFFGLGEKLVGIRYERFEVHETEDGFEFLVDLDRAALEAAPTYVEREE